MNKGRLIALVTGGLAAVISVSVRHAVMQRWRLVPPTIAAETATVTSVDTGAMKLSLSLTVLNSNARDLVLQDVAVSVDLDGLALGGGYDSGVLKVSQTAILAGGKRTQIVVPVDLDWKESSPFFRLTATPTPVHFTAEGHLELAGHPSQLWVPFHVEGTIAHELVQGSQKGLLRGLLQEAAGSVPGP